MLTFLFIFLVETQPHHKKIALIYIHFRYKRFCKNKCSVSYLQTRVNNKSIE